MQIKRIFRWVWQWTAGKTTYGIFQEQNNNMLLHIFNIHIYKFHINIYILELHVRLCGFFKLFLGF